MVPSLNIYDDCCEIVCSNTFQDLFFWKMARRPTGYFFHTLKYVVIFEHEYLKIYLR